MAYGLSVRFGPNSGQDINGNLTGLEFQTRLYTYDNTVGLTDSPFDLADWIFDENWVNPEGSSEIEVLFPL